MALSRRALAPVGRINKYGVVSSVNCHDNDDDDDVGDVPPVEKQKQQSTIDDNYDDDEGDIPLDNHSAI